MTAPNESVELRRWIGHDERVVHRSRWLTHYAARVKLPDGTRVDHHFVRTPAAAIVLAVDDEDQVLLMWRHRFVPDLWGWELPGGLVDEGEDPAVTAVRELEEETGFRASAVEPLLVYQPMAGMADSPHHLFLARGLCFTGEAADRTEAERTAWMSAEECAGVLGAGRILTSGTAVGLLSFLARRGVGLPAE
ncbi:NUDIX hydrolase [Streptomyces filamentosus]|uniref:NUDIX hydrolase n=2 Tax=Streptomyces filamentosus TaxID=67294 RepID=A0ABY4UWJ0_STRFL|nr:MULTISPECIES: NUDIX hydrolase [Streptomyces]MYR79837.1 NUDIX domain-containing protein [Streptomyces sp. SID5466]EFE75793.1 FrbI [Streptomyces filamentosus NRRL 15998]ESU48734.1 NUDIX hydrolase [Streptomyces sp. HCCB10043]EWS92811.1 FrbI protein [Streptomyces filamentosus NRRL 11379]USC48615.1 NUDIX hydrolase [Streptomyces filamentosus]